MGNKKNTKGIKVKKEKQDTVEIGFNSGMESIGEPVDIVYSLAKIYATVDN